MDAIDRLGFPARCPFTNFFAEGSRTKIDYGKSGYPYSNLFTSKTKLGLVFQIVASCPIRLGPFHGVS